MTRVVDALQQAGLVTRSPDPADGRGSLVSINAAGHRQLEEIRRTRVTALAHRLAELTNEQRAALAAALPALDAIPAAEPPRSATTAAEPPPARRQ